MQDLPILIPKPETFRNIRILPKYLRNHSEVGEPLQTSSPPPSLDSGTEKLKAKIFTKELEDLIQKVATKKKEIQSKGSPIRIIPKDKEVEYEMLLKVYENPENKELIADTMAVLLKNLGFPVFLFSVLDPFTGIYEPYYCHGVTDRTEKSFYIHESAPLLQNMKSDFVFKTIPQIQEDIFFSKYFSSEPLDSLHGILIQPLQILNHPFLICLLLDNSHSEVRLEDISKRVKLTLEPLFPILNKNIGKVKKLNAENLDITSTIHSFFKKKLNESSSKSIYIHKLIIPNYLNTYDRSKRKSDISHAILSMIKNVDLLLETGYNQFHIFCNENYQKELQKILQQMLSSEKEFQLEIFHYPEDISNVFLSF
jgi:hypothetical protein